MAHRHPCQDSDDADTRHRKRQTFVQNKEQSWQPRKPWSASRAPGWLTASSPTSNASPSTYTWPPSSGTGYVEAMEEAGWETYRSSPGRRLPRRGLHRGRRGRLPNVAVITIPGADSRKPEIIGAETAVARARCSDQPDPFTGHARRRRRAEDRRHHLRRQWRPDERRRSPPAAQILGPLGATIIAVPVPVHKALHLKSAVTAPARRHDHRLPAPRRRSLDSFPASCPCPRSRAPTSSTSAGTRS